MFWPAIAVATAGNTIGGAISWWMGYGAERAVRDRSSTSVSQTRALTWLRAASAPKACLLSWLPRASATRCARSPAGCKLPFWPCVVYMAIGKFARYLDDDGGAALAVPGPFTP